MDRAALEQAVRAQITRAVANTLQAGVPSAGMLNRCTETIMRAAAGWVAAEREHTAGQMDALAADYPDDVFPPGGTSRDAISGTAMRHAYRNAARAIRKMGDGPCPS